MAAADTELLTDEGATAAAAPVAASSTPRAPASTDGAPAKADKKDANKPGKKDAKKDAKKDGKKKGKEASTEGDGDGGPSVAAHPRAAVAVSRAKAWGGLAGFVLGGYLSLPTHTLADAGLRALVAGIVSYVAVWAGAVFVWRRLVMLELKAREQQLLSAAHDAAGELPPGRGRLPS